MKGQPTVKLHFIGDTHGKKDLAKVSPEALAQLGISYADMEGISAGSRDIGAANVKGISFADVFVHTGDLGAPWVKDDDETLRFWQNFPTPVLFNLGNHENFDWIRRQPVVERWGCRGRDLGGSLFAPLPGEIATVGGRKIWFYPGGYSVDYVFRNLGTSIFAEEMLTRADSEAAIARLKAEGPVDYIVSHDGPERFVTANFHFPISNPVPAYYEKTKTESGERVHPGFALNEVYQLPELYTYWYFGHHHLDISVGKLRCLYNRIVTVDTINGEEYDPLHNDQR